MAEIPNRPNPLNQYATITPTTLNATTITTTTIDATGSTIFKSSYTGSALKLKGNVILTGYVANGAIGLWQPVVPGTLTGTVSGASVSSQTNIIGVSSKAVADGAETEIVITGIVPMRGSGSAITLGGPVAYSPSGALVDTISAFAPGSNSGSLGRVIGIALKTGALANGTAEILIQTSY